MSFTSLGLAKDATISATIGTDGQSLISGAAIDQNDVFNAPLLANDTFQGGWFDITKVTRGLNSGFVAYCASMLTDVQASWIAIDVSQDGGVTFMRATQPVVVATNITTTTSGAMGSTGVTSVPITSNLGFIPGDIFVLDPGSNQETLTIAPGGVGASTLTTTTPTTKTHSSGVNVDGLYLATAEYQVRGFRYVRVVGSNGAVNATISQVSSKAKASA
jgi:hypothetical protein